jgi:hypothetical protein
MGTLNSKDSTLGLANQTQHIEVYAYIVIKSYLSHFIICGLPTVIDFLSVNFEMQVNYLYLLSGIQLAQKKIIPFSSLFKILEG